MAPAGTSPPIERLPPELLEKVLAAAPVLDILRMKQVNRRFRDFIQASPRTKYRIDLLAVGLEDNPTAHHPLFDKQRALDEYRMKWDAFSPIQKREREIDGFARNSLQASSSGVCGFALDRGVSGKAIQFVTLESVSRGIPRNEWKVPLPPDLSLQRFAFNYHADVLVLVGRQATFSVHLRSMTTDEPHPAAKLPDFTWPGTNNLTDIHAASVTNSRLAIIVGHPHLRARKIFVWNWRTRRILVEKAYRLYRCLNFVNEFTFVVLSYSFQWNRPQLHVINTEHGTIIHSVETLFSLPARRIAIPLSLSSGPCDYTPSPDELTAAPFHSDPSQRILALKFREHGWDVVNVELLLKLARERESQSIGWDEWKTKIIQVNETSSIDCVWISGCRLFCVTSSRGVLERSSLQIYDFSYASRAKSLASVQSTDTGGGTRQMLPSLDRYRLPWSARALSLATPTAGHDSVVVFVVTRRKYFQPPDQYDAYMESLMTTLNEVGVGYGTLVQLAVSDGNVVQKT